MTTDLDGINTSPDLPEPSDRLTDLIGSFRLARYADGLVESTVRGNTDATVKLARWLTREGIDSWHEVTTGHLRAYMVWVLRHARTPAGGQYERGYANNQYRNIQQWWKWFAEDEGVPDPMAGMKPPKLIDKVTPIIGVQQLGALLAQAEKKNDFESRRDTAILRLFACSGLRLSELTTILVEDLNLEKSAVKVVGKGMKERVIRFDRKTQKALDRYIRVRRDHKYHDHKRLWLAVNNRGPLTPNGMRQAVQRRGVAVGVQLHPHMFRHTFTHLWLAAGGAEGDLMELNGWDSPQMLRHYAKAARGERARGSYDRVNVLGDL